MNIKYSFYKEIDGMKVYRSFYDKYIIEFYDDNNRLATLHFYFDFDGSLIVDNLYIGMRNYKAYRYLKKYAENKILMSAMMQLKPQ